MAAFGSADVSAGFVAFGMIVLLRVGVMVETVLAIGSGVVALFAEAGAAAGLGSVTAGGVFKTVAVSFLVTAAEFAVNSAFQTGGGKGVNAPGVKQSIRQSVPKQRLIYGRSLVGGALFFYECKPPHLYLGLLHAAHEIDAIEEIRIGTERVFLDGSGNALSVPFKDGSDVFFKCSVRNGTTSQAIDPILDADFTSLPSTFRQRGHACSVSKADYGNDVEHHEKLWGSNFNPLFLIRGKKVYDPRDRTQVLGEPSTYKWSDTASLCIADFIATQNPAWGGSIGESGVNWDYVARAADRDDEMVYLADGTWQKRYTINGVIQADQKTYDVVQSMLTANRGSIVQIDGKACLISGGPQEPVMTIHDGIILGGFEFRSEKPRKELVNIVRTEFVAPDREYQVANGPVFEDDDWKALDGEPLEATIRLPFTETAPRAQRLAKAYANDVRLGRAVTLQVDLVAVALTAGDVIRLWSDTFPIMNGLYSVTSVSFINGFGALELGLSEYSPTIYDWNYETNEKPFELVVTEAA